MPRRAIRHGPPALALIAFLTGPPSPLRTTTAGAADPVPTAARAPLIGTDGNAAGTAVLTTHRDHPRIEVAAPGLPPGFHGLHIHEKGVCDPAATPKPFTTAGGH